MKMILFTAICLVGLFLSGCGAVGSAGSEQVTVKYPGTDSRVVDLQDGGFYSNTKTWTWKGNRETTPVYYLCSANHQFITDGYSALGKDVEKAEDVKICFQLNGPKGDKETPLETGSYKPAGVSMANGPHYNSISSVLILTHEDGKPKEHSMTMFKTKGEIKLTSVTDDSISGEVDLDDGENAVKGTFSANAIK